MKTSSSTALLLSLFVKNPARPWTIPELLRELQTDENRENVRWMRICMGRVARKLCYEHEVLLLSSGNKYWITNLKTKADRLIFEQRDRRRVKAIESINNRLRAELEIAAAQGFPLEIVYALRKQLAKIARRAAGRL